MLCKHFASNISATSTSNERVTLGLSTEEENTIRYMSGYVTLKLKRKYEKQESSKSAEYVECLSSLAVGGQESSFYEYTKEWTRLVDRGGLFHVNDSGYLFFRALELKARAILPQHLKNPSGSQDLLIQDLKNDEDIQFFWCTVSTDITDSSDADQLLADIMKLWITIRGFSVTSNWMNEYQNFNKKSVKKKALHKTLRPVEPKESSETV